VEQLPDILKQKTENMAFDQARFVAGLKSIFGELPEGLKTTKKS
jgi:hypothetical protein